MPLSTFRNTALILAAGASLGACTTYGDYGYGGAGYGGGYGGYGDYGGYDGYGGYGRGARNSITVSIGSGNYYGWNDGYYYPGNGYYIYDNARRPYRWNNVQQRYWGDRRSMWRHHNRGAMRSSWGDFNHRRRR